MPGKARTIAEHEVHSKRTTVQYPKKAESHHFRKEVHDKYNFPASFPNLKAFCEVDIEKDKESPN